MWFTGGRMVRSRRLAAALLCLGLGTSLARAADMPALGQIETFRLENGLTVILAPVRTDRGLVSVRMRVGVGSGSDPRDAIGLAHLVEHLVAELPWDRWGSVLWHACGRSARVNCNATTRAEATDYYLTVPQDHLPLALWAQAQFLGARDQDFVKSEVIRQRSVVKNEGRLKLEGVPYSRARLRLTELLGLYIQSYASEREIGESLSDVGPERVAEFYRRHYGPGAATLVITGDFGLGYARAWIDGTVALVPPAAARPSEPATTKVAVQSRGVTEDERQEVAPALFFAWPTPAYHAPGDAEADVAARVLAGPAGRLRRLTRAGGPLQGVSAGQQSLAGTSVFFLTTIARPGRPSAEIEGEIDRVLTELAEKGIGEEELDGARAMLLTALAASLERPEDRALALLGWHRVGGGDVRAGLAHDRKRYGDLQVEDIRRFVRQYLVPSRRLTVRAAPPSTEATP